jgi:hypothetical protein
MGLLSAANADKGEIKKTNPTKSMRRFMVFPFEQGIHTNDRPEIEILYIFSLGE